MRKQSWASLALSFERYAHTEAVGRFVEEVTRRLHPLALILFGSLARGDYHTRSDADFCVILDGPGLIPVQGGYDQVVACDPSGVVQPLVYNGMQFRQMVREANGLALEVMADGVFLAGDEAFWQEIEELAMATQRRLGVERTLTGWRFAQPGAAARPAEQESLSTRLQQASASASARAAHLSDAEIDDLIERARTEVNQRRGHRDADLELIQGTNRGRPFSGRSSGNCRGNQPLD